MHALSNKMRAWWDSSKVSIRDTDVSLQSLFVCDDATLRLRLNVVLFVVVVVLAIAVSVRLLLRLETVCLSVCRSVGGSLFLSVQPEGRVMEEVRERKEYAATAEAKELRFED